MRRKPDRPAADYAVALPPAVPLALGRGLRIGQTTAVRFQEAEVDTSNLTGDIDDRRGHRGKRNPSAVPVPIARQDAQHRRGDRDAARTQIGRYQWVFDCRLIQPTSGPDPKPDIFRIRRPSD